MTAKYLLLSLLAATLASHASAAEYFIDPTGSDSAAGTSPATAWASLSPMARIRQGDIVNLKAGGRWSIDTGLFLDGTTLRSYGIGPRPRIDGKNIKFATIQLRNNATVDGLTVTADAFFGVYLIGNRSTLRNTEIDGTNTKIQMAVGIMGNDNVVTHNYAHDLTADTGDTGNPNSSGGSEAFVVFGGKNIDVSYNAAVRAACKNKTLGGDEGGGFEIINPKGGTTVENVRFHHNYVEDCVGFFEACTGTGTGNEDPSKNPGTIKNITLSYNLSVNSKWLYLLQILNTHLDNVVFEHNTIIHTERNEKIWSKDFMSHQDMLGMFFYSDSFTGSSISDQVKPTDLIVRDNLFVEPFSRRREGLWIGGGFAHYNNIFSPATLPLGTYKLDPTELKLDKDKLALTPDFRLSAKSLAIDKASDKTTFTLDLDGHKLPPPFTLAPDGTKLPNPEKPDVGASEYVEGGTINTPGFLPMPAAGPASR